MVNQGEELLKQFTFDSANQMSQSAGNVDGVWKKAAYQYNGLGQRVGQKTWNTEGVAEVHSRHKAGMTEQSAIEMVEQPVMLPQNPEQGIRYTLDLTKQYHNLLHRGDTQKRKRPDLLLGWECRQYAGRWRGKFLLAGRSWKPDGTA